MKRLWRPGYRFLVDPQPPDSVKKAGDYTVVEQCPEEEADCGVAGTCVGGFCADKTVLAQRQAFLRDVTPWSQSSC